MTETINIWCGEVALYDEVRPHPPDILYRNKGAMTKGTTEETADRMALDKINAIIDDLRYERYRWSPARRVYIPKKNGVARSL